MAKGDKVKNEFHTYKDEYTGNKVTRLTSPDVLSHHPYFYNKMFTNDGRYLIYASNKDGNRNYYKMNLSDGSALQLTEGSGNTDFGGKLTHDDMYLQFVSNNSIVRLSMSTLEEEIIYETEEGWTGYVNPGLSSDSRYIATVEMNDRDKVKRMGNWDTFSIQWGKNLNVE